jgi:hypothetical protein
LAGCGKGENKTMSKKKNSKSFEITLSAVSCTVAVVFLYLGTFNTYMLATGYLMAEIALMLPLSKQFYAGDALAFIGTCILTILLGALGRIWVLVPFIIFFGLHPLINALQLRFKINKWLAFFIKAAWFDLSLWAAYALVFGSSIGNPSFPYYELINQYVLVFIFVGGTIIFFPYDYLMFKCQMMVNALVYRIHK